MARKSDWQIKSLQVLSNNNLLQIPPLFYMDSGEEEKMGTGSLCKYFVVLETLFNFCFSLLPYIMTNVL